MTTTREHVLNAHIFLFKSAFRATLQGFGVFFLFLTTGIVHLKNRSDTSLDEPYDISYRSTMHFSGH